MYVRPHFPIRPAIVWTWKVIPAVGIWSAILTGLHDVFELEWLQLPGIAVGVMGTAVSFYLGFKGSAAYGRLWEARKIWGGIVNTSRTWGLHVKTMVSDLHRDTPGDPPLPDLHRELIYRHIAWLGALRTQLRRRKSWEHDRELNNVYRQLHGTFDQSDEKMRERLAPFIPAEELDALMAQKNRATQLLRRQGERVQELFAQRRVEDFRHMELAHLLETLYTLQGKCERIKNFPLPRQYATANHWFVFLFVAVLPLGLIAGFHVNGLPEAFVWATVPASILVGWMFFTWDQVLDYSENPFEGLVNDVPIDALSRTIEIDLREMLGETDLPPAAVPSERDALM